MCYKRNQNQQPQPMCDCAEQLITALTPIPKKIGIFYQEDTAGTKVFPANSFYSVSITGHIGCVATIFLDDVNSGVLLEAQTIGFAMETLITQAIKIVSTSGNYQVAFTEPILNF